MRITMLGLSMLVLAACSEREPPAPRADAAADNVLKTQTEALKAAEAIKAQAERDAAEREQALQEMTGG